MEKNFIGRGIDNFKTKVENARKEREMQERYEEAVVELAILKEENEELKGIKSKVAMQTREEIKDEYEDKIAELKGELASVEKELKEVKANNELITRGHKEEIDKLKGKIREQELTHKEEVHKMAMENKDIQYKLDNESTDVTQSIQYLELKAKCDVLTKEVEMMKEQSDFFKDSSQGLIGAVTGRIGATPTMIGTNGGGNTYA